VYAPFDPVLVPARWMQRRGQQVEGDTVDLKKISWVAPVPAPTVGSADSHMAPDIRQAPSHRVQVRGPRSSVDPAGVLEDAGSEYGDSRLAPNRGSPAVATTSTIDRARLRLDGGLSLTQQDKIEGAFPESVNVRRERFVEQAVAWMNDTRGVPYERTGGSERYARVGTAAADRVFKSSGGRTVQA
jgi:hypothetical protein